MFHYASGGRKTPTEEDEDKAAETTHISPDVFQQLFLAQVAIFFALS